MLLRGLDETGNEVLSVCIISHFAREAQGSFIRFSLFAGCLGKRGMGGKIGKGHSGAARALIKE
jgi:hypothetical protein